MGVLPRRKQWAGLAIVVALFVISTAGPAQADTPIINSFSPTSGTVGTSVTIHGLHFTGTTSVAFNGTNAVSFTVDSGGKITATVPSGATTGKISVTAPDGTATSSVNFTVTTQQGGPTISGFSPNSGPVGTSVTINGSNFTGATSVKFNGASATTYTVNSGSKITATVPSGATTGKISVTAPGGTATSSGTFTVTSSAAPKITSFSPTSGPVGTSVTINGSNLTGATSVKFNGASATTYTVNSASKITATVPTGATTGKISVTTPGGTASSSNSFTVTGKSHSRAVSLQLSRHLVAKGSVTATDGFSACEQSVPVRIQRRRSGRWHTVGGTLTRMDGSYRIRIGDRSGKYRARATRTSLASGDICGRATSGVTRHRR